MNTVSRESVRKFVCEEWHEEPMPPWKIKSLAPERAPAEILDQFVGRAPLSVEELGAAIRRFHKAIVEPALGGDLTHHVGCPLAAPTRRAFEPRLIPKHAGRFGGCDDKILARYARGMTVREIQARLAEMYPVEYRRT